MKGREVVERIGLPCGHIHLYSLVLQYIHALLYYYTGIMAHIASISIVGIMGSDY